MYQETWNCNLILRFSKPEYNMHFEYILVEESNPVYA